MSVVALNSPGNLASPTRNVRTLDRSPRAEKRNPRGLLAAQRRLHSADSTPDLLSCACEVAREWCGFSRALVVCVEDGTLAASGLGAVSDHASDLLRRRLLAEPITLRSGAAESDFIKVAEGGRPEGQKRRSLLQQTLGLAHFALGAVMPEDRVLALLVVDRDDPPVDALDRYVVQAVANLLASAVERLALRQRMGEFALELRYLTTSAQALLKEGISSPVAIPVDNGSGPVFAKTFDAPQPADQLREPFTRRELSIVQEMVSGRSNHEIAAVLQLSPETVKKYVGRVIHKLGASNRADAAVRYLRLTSATES